MVYAKKRSSGSKNKLDNIKNMIYRITLYISVATRLENHIHLTIKPTPEDLPYPSNHLKI